jgi:hypothetical protein
MASEMPKMETVGRKESVGTGRELKKLKGHVARSHVALELLGSRTLLRRIHVGGMCRRFVISNFFSKQ